MRVLVPVLVVLILVLGALIALRMVRGSNAKKELGRKFDLADNCIDQLAREIDLSVTAGSALDPMILDSIINEYKQLLKNPNNKEINR
jgi:tRNA A37 threonylcarbamoyltransferase TsaD